MTLSSQNQDFEKHFNICKFNQVGLFSNYCLHILFGKSNFVHTMSIKSGMYPEAIFV